MRHTNLEKFCPENRPMAWDLNDLQTPSSRARHSWGNEGNAGSQIPKISQMNWDLSRGFEQVGTWWWVHPIPFWHLQSIYRSAMTSARALFLVSNFSFLVQYMYSYIILYSIIIYTHAYMKNVRNSPQHWESSQLWSTEENTFARIWGRSDPPMYTGEVAKHSPMMCSSRGGPVWNCFGINTWHLKSQNWREPGEPIRSWWGPPGAGVLRR